VSIELEEDVMENDPVVREVEVVQEDGSVGLMDLVDESSGGLTEAMGLVDESLGAGEEPLDVERIIEVDLLIDDPLA
jgi:hypothetical protein